MHEYEFFLTLLVAAAVTYLLTPLVRRTAIRVGAVLPARDRDVHAAPIPRMGGIAIYVGVAAGLLVADQLGMLNNVISSTNPVTGLLPAGAVIMIIGIIDDRWGMNSTGKLAGQVAAAGVLFASGAQLSNFPEPNDHLFTLTNNESLVLTILVVVATINAVNFIDGLDGLAAGIVCIAAISFFVYYYSLAQKVNLPEETGPALASVVLAGACLGFLPHNFHPARIFMGDTGSMLLGLLLSYIPISAISSLDFTNLQNKANRYGELLPLLLPAAVLVIPYVDLLRAVVRRTRAGQSPFAADRKHLHHQMLEIGHSHRSSVLILYAWAALFAGAIVGLSIVTVKLAVLAGTTMAAVLVLGLLSIPKLRWWQRDRVPEPTSAAGVTAVSRAVGTVSAPATRPAMAGVGPPVEGAGRFSAAEVGSPVPARDGMSRGVDVGSPVPGRDGVSPGVDVGSPLLGWRSGGLGNLDSPAEAGNSWPAATAERPGLAGRPASAPGGRASAQGGRASAQGGRASAAGGRSGAPGRRAGGEVPPSTGNGRRRDAAKHRRTVGAAPDDPASGEVIAGGRSAQPADATEPMRAVRASGKIIP